MNTAILFIIYNRIETTRKVFEAIRLARPPQLYVAADGPCQNQPDEYELCEEARKVATAVDWPCELNTLFREKNLGCGKAVSEAITWFFKHVPEGIILEDDCVPDQSFFRFCEELLEKYRNEPRVMHIGGIFVGSGSHKIPRKISISTSYFFSKNIVIWGWASWRRAWNLYDYHIENWKDLQSTDWLLKIGGGSKSFHQAWERRFQLVCQSEVDTWDFQWIFSIWFQNGLSILPTRNLVTNMGFHDMATHTKKGDGFFDKLPMESIKFPLRHPNHIELNQEMDNWIDQINNSLYIKVNRSFILQRIFLRLKARLISYFRIRK